MKKWLALILLFSVSVSAQNGNPPFTIIPEPASLVAKPGVFLLTPVSGIWVEGNDRDALRVGKFLADALSVPTGYKLSVKSGANISRKAGAILLRLNQKADPSLGNEGYKLSVATSGVTIEANQPA